jgi:hypothetical protein
MGNRQAIATSLVHASALCKRTRSTKISLPSLDGPFGISALAMSM